MRLTRIIPLTIGTSLLLWIGAVHQASTGDSQPPTPLRTSPLALESATTAATVSTRPTLVPVDRTAAEQELVDWAEARFALVGLDLPAAEISFHDDTEPCDGADGIYHSDSPAPRVLVCIPDRGTFASNLERQRTLVHELAHAWEQANLDDAERDALLETIDADEWYAPDSAWEERGAERFAETLVWGLYDQIRRPTLIEVPCQELHADFIAITGHTAPGPLAGVCSPEQG